MTRSMMTSCHRCKQAREIIIVGIIIAVLYYLLS